MSVTAAGPSIRLGCIGSLQSSAELLRMAVTVTQRLRQLLPEDLCSIADPTAQRHIPARLRCQCPEAAGGKPPTQGGGGGI